MNLEINARLRAVFDFYLHSFDHSFDEYVSKRTRLKLPLIPFDLLKDLLTLTKEIFSREAIVLDISMPVTIIGDIHGHLLDLLRILSTFGPPPQARYLFLGDFVDRGEFSTETITLVYLMKCLFPQDVFIIRGNHEFAEICEYSGFTKEIRSLYTNDGIAELFFETFNYTPLAARIGDVCFCVHGGIGPDLFHMTQIEMVKRPLFTYDSPDIADLLWSDPSNEVKEYAESSRGLGHLFGEAPLKAFLASTGCRVLVRGHQCVEEGVKKAFVYTVFSASNYCGEDKNRGGVLTVTEDGVLKPTTFPPIGYIMRRDAILYPFSGNRPMKRRKQSDPRISSSTSFIRPMGFRNNTRGIVKTTSYSPKAFTSRLTLR